MDKTVIHILKDYGDALCGNREGGLVAPINQLESLEDDEIVCGDCVKIAKEILSKIGKVAIRNKP